MFKIIMDKGSKLLTFILLILFVGIIIHGAYNRSKLKTEGVPVEARIIGYGGGGKGGNSIICEFIYNNKWHETTALCSVPLAKWHRIKYFTFPAMYSPRSGLLKLLILREDYEDFNKPYPDSMARWVAKHVFGD